MLYCKVHLYEHLSKVGLVESNGLGSEMLMNGYRTHGYLKVSGLLGDSEMEVLCVT